MSGYSRREFFKLSVGLLAPKGEGSNLENRIAQNELKIGKLGFASYLNYQGISFNNKRLNRLESLVPGGLDTPPTKRAKKPDVTNT